MKAQWNKPRPHHRLHQFLPQNVGLQFEKKSQDPHTLPALFDVWYLNLQIQFTSWHSLHINIGSVLDLAHYILPSQDIAMRSFRKLFHLLLWFLIIIFLFMSTTCAMSRVGELRRKVQPKGDHSMQKDLKILYYSQTLDHFNYQPESYMTFKQKYMIYSKQWGGAHANSPIFVYLGDEQPMDAGEIDAIILPDYAAHMKALVVIIEHRFYGESIPFGMSMGEVVKNASIRGYFNSAQALADYAELILHLKKSLNANYSPIIVFGGSYGGMLASWFRLKYPHIAIGALASSAPVLYFDDIIPPNHGYYSIVSKDFQETSKSCFKTIRKSWEIIDKIGSKPDGLLFLSKKFNTCANLNTTDELKNFLESIYDTLAQYEDPSVVCNIIDKQKKGVDIISRIYAGVIAYFGVKNCYDTNYFFVSETSVGYAWQTCSEMVMPAAYGTSDNSMFPIDTFNMSDFVRSCKDEYNVLPRPHWITTYYGGHDMKLVLERFGSNIIFSNGLKDPYSSAGVLKDISDSILALYTINGTHCKDISSASKDDPEWLIDQRKREVDTINGWIERYYADLQHYLN